MHKLNFVFLLVCLISNPCLGQDEVFAQAESQPVFPGGMEAFYGYVNEQLSYPAAARNAEVEGKVFVQFVVDATGKLTQVKTVKGIGSGCDAEAERILKNAPPFIPGYNHGKPVKVMMIMPILFTLNSAEAASAPYRPAARSLEAAASDPGVKQLVLTFQGIAELDGKIGGATHLEYVNLTGNELTMLPEEIGGLSDLQELHLTYNALASLPETFSSLQSLRTLYLDRNDLAVFPQELLALRNLQTIDISYTGIAELPRQIAEMPQLQTIYARGTSISGDQIRQIKAANPAIDILK